MLEGEQEVKKMKMFFAALAITLLLVAFVSTLKAQEIEQEMEEETAAGQMPMMHGMMGGRSGMMSMMGGGMMGPMMQGDLMGRGMMCPMCGQMMQGGMMGGMMSSGKTLPDLLPLRFAD